MYLWHRVGRLHGTPHSIAAGFASGTAVSFTPFVGVHFILAAFMSWFARGNIIAGLIGTGVGNPWTFPFIWWWTYMLGTKMGAGPALQGRQPDFLSIFTDLFGVLGKAVVKFQLDSAYFENVWAIIWPMMVGSVPTFIVVWMVTYLLLKPLVTAYQGRRIARRRRKLKKEREAKALADAENQEVTTLPVREEAPLAESMPMNQKSSS
jgi:uncharacterized protein (DUF2062 family)